MKASDVIREARNVLFERGRTRFFTHDKRDDSVCLIGALGVARTGDPYKGYDCHPEHRFVRLAAGSRLLVDFNRRSTDTEVFDALDRAEKLALIAEESDE